MSTPFTRQDGRAPLDTRPISLSLGQLSRADGSARFAYGSTACIASFSGPIEVRIREEQPDRATLEVSHRPLEGVGATPSRALEATLTASISPLLALDQHPRSLLQLVVQSLSAPAHKPSAPPSDAPRTHTWPPPTESTPAQSAPTTPISMSERAAALTAASLAILDAGSVALSSTLVAVSLALVPRAEYVDLGPGAAGGSGPAQRAKVDLVVDPSPEEEARAAARFGFGWAFGRGMDTRGKARGGEVDMDDDEEEGVEAGLAWVEAEGSFTRDQYELASSTSKVVARDVLQVLRGELERHMTKGNGR